MKNSSGAASRCAAHLPHARDTTDNMYQCAPLVVFLERGSGPTMRAITFSCFLLAAGFCLCRHASCEGFNMLDQLSGAGYQSVTTSLKTCCYVIFLK